MVLDVYSDVLLWTIGIFIVVEFLLLLALWRYRRRPGDSGVPDQVHGHTLLEIGWTLVPALILFFIAIPTVQTIFETQAKPAPGEDPLEITVIGHQWWWEIIYPELGITTANELHIPRDRKAVLTLTSADVIHSFWVPRLGGKRDLNPGWENTLWFTPDSAGVYDGQCAEFCGVSHANMRLRVVVLEPEEFDSWVDREQLDAPPDSIGLQAFLSSGCQACHTLNGTVAQGKLGPNLTHIGSHSTIAAGIVANTPENLSGWLRNPDSIKPGSLMPDLGLNEERISALVDYLERLK